ncbi:MAG: phage terminase large subunit [Opitutaceae bacterium]|nr:phage terminase large subunit [Opitutaceae bacterium]
MALETATLIKPREAEGEKARREKARRRLSAFCHYVSRWYRRAPHLDLAAEMLEQVEIYIRTKGRTGVGRLLIFMPPRHGKSELVSKHFPAWVLGKLPDTRVILASYGADLAVSNSRAAREIVMGQQYKALFGEASIVETPVELSADSRSVEAWDLSRPHRGGVVATGVGGGITGKGAHLLIIDDPFKNREEAESALTRERVWNWWTSSAYTRLEDGGAVVGMLTRWHPDDWAGRLLRAMGEDPSADQYVVVCLPALAAPEKVDDESRRAGLLRGVWIEGKDALGRKAGQALWPEKYDEAVLGSIRSNIGIYDFEALYQQNPYLRSGSFFLREWLPVVEHMPKAYEIAERVRYWDKAASARGDYTAGVLMCRTHSGEYYIEHVARIQANTGERDRLMLETGKYDRTRQGPQTTQYHQQDPGAAGRDSAEATNLMYAKAGIAARFEPLSGDKEVRAGPFSSACQGGRVRLLRGGWNEAFIEELASFPLGKHDDQVDAAASAFNRLASGGPVILFGA